MDDFATKPIDAERLYLMLAKWLPAQGEAQRDSAAETDAIDLAVLGKLFVNDAAKVAKFARSFVRTTRTALTEMEAAHARRDLEALGGLGHKQKSAARSAGALSFAALCQEMEDASKAGDWPRAEVLLAQLPPLLERIAVQVERQTG